MSAPAPIAASPRRPSTLVIVLALLLGFFLVPQLAGLVATIFGGLFLLVIFIPSLTTGDPWNFSPVLAWGLDFVLLGALGWVLWRIAARSGRLSSPSDPAARRVRQAESARLCFQSAGILGLLTIAPTFGLFFGPWRGDGNALLGLAVVAVVGGLIMPLLAVGGYLRWQSGQRAGTIT